MGKTEFLEMYLNLRLKVLVWTRVMGYMRNVESFNVGKKSEFDNRVFFKIKNGTR